MFAKPKPKSEYITHKEGIKMVNKILNESLDTYFMEHSAEMRQRLLDAGFDPNEVDEKISAIKLKAQVFMIDEFKKEFSKTIQNKIIKHAQSSGAQGKM